MATIIRHGDTCTIKMSKSSKTVEAVVHNFVFEKTLDVVLNKSVKLNLKWNGKIYEGRGAGLDVESNGPEIYKTQTGLRG